MNRFLIITLLFAMVGGCQEPSEITLRPDDKDDLEVTPIMEADSSVGRPTIDTTAVLFSEHEANPGLVMMNQVTYDAGVRVVDTAFSRVFFADRQRPIYVSGRLVGYSGLQLGLPVTLNGSPMVQVPHRISIRRLLADTVILAGYEYLSSLTFQPNAHYRWVAPPSPMIGGVDIAIQSTDKLVVDSPRGGTVVPRNQNLELRWRGQGQVFWIIISKVNLLSRRTTPLLRIKPRVNRGQAIIPAKIIQSLPRDRSYVFTFVLANRSQVAVTGYLDRVLVQAASVYNSYIEIR